MILVIISRVPGEGGLIPLRIIEIEKHVFFFWRIGIEKNNIMCSA